MINTVDGFCQQRLASKPYDFITDSFDPIKHLSKFQPFQVFWSIFVDCL
jgi:hypothetical protein